MKCFFHSADLDGHCSGAIVKHKFPECECIGINYGKEFPFDDIVPGETVYMVDFSLPIMEMVALYQKCELIWIDHHASAIDAYRKRQITHPGFKIKGLLDPNASSPDPRERTSGCELTWKYLFPDTRMPEAVRLLGRYDVWDHSDSLTLRFQYGMRMEETRPYNDGALLLWNALFAPTASCDVTFRSIMDRGTIIFTYQRGEDKKYANAYHFVTNLHGFPQYRVLALNRGMSNSKVFDDIWDPEQHDIMMVFCWSGRGNWKVSLYTEKDDVINLGPIAKVLDSEGKGGGHRGAAGFHCKELPFPMVKWHKPDKEQEEKQDKGENDAS